MKKFFCVLLAVILLSASSVAFAASIPQPVLDARGSVVYILVENDEGTFTGSGFAIGESGPIEYIVTNHHVIEGNNGTFVVFSGDNASTNASVITDVPSIDACVLKLDTPINNMRPLLLYDGEPAKLAGEQIYTLGFPGSADYVFMRTGNIAEDVTITDGIVSGAKKSSFGMSGELAMGLQINASIYGGNSGGPLVNDDGVVLGINTFSSAVDTNLNGALSISELLPILDREGIPYKVNSNIIYSGLLWLILAIAAVAAAFLIWLFILRKKFKQNKTVSLAEYLEKHGGKFDYDQAISLLAPIVIQLNALHRENKSHLAVYPQSIRIQFSTGSAFLVAPKSHFILNGYSAPEQYRELEQTGPWTDIYQLGAVFYRLLTGERLPDVMARLENDNTSKQEIESLQLLSGTKQALRLAIALKPDIRLGNAAQFLTAFHIAPNSVRTLTGNIPVKKERKKLTAKKKRRIIALCVTGGVVAILCLGAGWFVTTNNNAYDYLKENDYARANQTISKLPSLTKGISAIKSISEAGMLLESKQYEEARRLLEGLEAYPEARELSSMIDLWQGLGLLASGQTEDGEAYIETFLEKDPDFDRDVIDYARGNSYFTAGNFIKAERIFSELGDFEDAQARAKTSALAAAKQFVEKENYKSAIDYLKKYSDDPDVRDMIKDLQSLIYVQGMDYIDEKDYDAALECFLMIPGYEDSDSYIDVLGALNYHELEPYIDTVLGQDVLYHSGYMLYDYLTGYWSNGSYYFEMEANGDTHYNIPWVDGDGYYYEIDTNGIYISGGRECFQFSVIDADSMDVYAFANGNTYRMYRQ